MMMHLGELGYALLVIQLVLPSLLVLDQSPTE